MSAIPPTPLEPWRTKLRLGASSWTAEGWIGSFYPEGTKSADYLGHYATHFDVVEADVTYYRIPSARMVANWRERTPPGFLLAAKFPRAIVHGGDGPKPDPARVLVPGAVGDEVANFLTVMQGLGDRCGPLLLQFPYFNQQVFRGPDEFLRRLDDFLGHLPADFRYAVEVRNKAYVAQPLLDVLRRHHACLALVDLHYMPHPDTWLDRLDLATADFGYVRLIGNREVTEARTKVFDREYVDQSEGLARWAAFLRGLAARLPVTFVFANNHYAGHAPATLRRLQQLLAVPAAG